MRTKVAIVAPLLLAVILFLDDIKIARENNRNINSAIYPAFRQIEANVGAKWNRLEEQGKDPKLWMSQRELWVWHQKTQNLAVAAGYSDDIMYSDEYYTRIHELGYPLPPFYKPGYQKKFPKWKFWADKQSIP